MDLPLIKVIIFSMNLDYMYFRKIQYFIHITTINMVLFIYYPSS